MKSCCAISEARSWPAVHVCPACGQPAKKVKRGTVENLLRPCMVSRMEETQYYFCETPNCPVVYFRYDADGTVFQKPDLCVRVGLKETEDPLPICYCLEITRKDIWDEIRQTGATTAAGRIKAEVQAGHCACEVKNPSGKCCLANVARVAQQGFTMIRPLAGASKTSG